MHFFNKISILFTCIYCIFCTSIVNYVRAEDSINKIVASVAGEPVTYYDVLGAMLPQMQEAGLSFTKKEDALRVKRLQETVLNDLINSILIRQEAVKYSVKVTDQDIDSEMRKIARENGVTLDVLEQQIKIQGNSINNFKKNLRNTMLQQRMIGTFVFRKIVVTNLEVEEYYKKNIDIFRADSKYFLRFITFPTQEQAQQALSRIQSTSTTFASYSKAYAEKNGSSKVGELDSLLYSELSPEWQQALASAKRGDTVGPIKVDTEYFIIYVSKVEEGKALPLEDVYSSVEGKIRDAKFSSYYADFVESLRKKADITLYK